MLTYPQLSTGAAAQYPSRKTRAFRTVANEAADGRSIRSNDAGATRTVWKLEYSGLIDDEAAALEEFFRATEGRLKTFRMLDPLGNLLAWSEKLDEDVWERDPLIILEEGREDSLGTQRATLVRNPGGGVQGVRQTIEAPQRTYCFSAFARSETAGGVVLLNGSGRREFAVGPEWRRLTLTEQGSGSGESVVFGIEIEAGASVELFGLQAEAQTGASGYRKSRSRGGVYQDARFVDDSLRIVADGTNQHSCVVRIEHVNHI